MKTKTLQRNKKTGEYERAPLWKRFLFSKNIVLVATLFSIFLVGYGAVNIDTKPLDYKPTDIAQANTLINEDDIADIRKTARKEVITEMQYQIVDELARDCETLNRKEPDSTIIFDTNNEPSIGAWQYQRDTVVRYYKKFYHQEITRTEAIAIAIDHDKARELTRKILFEEEGAYYEGGYGNWTNCARKLNLPSRIDSINAIQPI